MPESLADGRAAPDCGSAVAGVDTTVFDEFLAAVESLPDRYLEALWLRDVLELGYAEISELLGVPVATVTWRRSRGRRLVCECLYGHRPTDTQPTLVTDASPTEVNTMAQETEQGPGNATCQLR